MFSDSDIDGIVKRVLQQLDAGGPVAQREAVGETPASSANGESTHFADAVLTEQNLDGRLGGLQRITVGPRTILTPTARDLLRSRGIEWNRAEQVRQSSSGNANGTTAKVITVQHREPAERAIADLLPDRNGDLTDDADSAAAAAISAICRGETTQVLILADEQHRAACQANRNEQVRAVAIRDATDIEAAASQLRPNVWCVGSGAATYFEFRNLIATLKRHWNSK